jgi:aldose 1-epimerase
VIEPFGQLQDGSTVETIALGEPGGLQLEVLTYGAILRRLSFPVQGRSRQLVLALDRLEDYVQDRAYVGPVVGRFGNRIAGGRFCIDGDAYQLTRNEKGNHLHGGERGVGKRLWRLLDRPSQSRATLGLHSADGDEGYPGNLDITLELTILADAVVMQFTAQADAPTPVNLTCHPYFNLGGTLADHRLRIPASRYLPVGPGLIPTGELASVEGNAFDFRAMRRIAPPPLRTDPQLQLGGGYDHCWVIDDGADCHCELLSPQQDLSLRVRSSGPGLQFYGGQFLAQSQPGVGAGLALEPQGFPDAPNHAAFPDSILRPGNTYRARIEYQLRAL